MDNTNFYMTKTYSVEKAADAIIDMSSLSKLDESSDSIDSVSQDSSWDEASISSEISQMKRETFHQVQ